MFTETPIQKNFTVGFKPKQIIPESEKTRDWAISNVDWCISMLPVFTKRHIDHYYDIYNGRRSNEDYRHITETYGIQFPAGKLKHNPLIRPMINELQSEMEERGLNFNVYSEDPDSVAEKVVQISDKLIYDVANAIKLTASPEELDLALNQLEQEYKKFQTDNEIGAFKILRNFIQRDKTERKFADMWLDKLISGMEYYRVSIDRIGEDPNLDIIRPGTLWWAGEKVKWVRECSWAVKVDEMSPVQIVDKFGERMLPADRQTLEEWMDMYSKDAFYKLGPGETMETIFHDSTVINAVNDHRITVYTVEWKSSRKVKYIESPNKYRPDAPFIKFLDDDQIYKMPNERKKLIKERYVQDLYHGVRIGDSMYVDLGRHQYPQYSMSKPGRVYLSFNGPTFNGKVKPYSLMGETKDLQDSYDILHWHRENLVALSGVKGSFMDLSQLPDFGTGKLADNIKMYFYYRKLGAAFINTAQEGANKNYNQFSNYDDTLGAGLEAITAMIQQLEESASRITGVNRQRMASLSSADGKATSEMALQQSGMITEHMFNEHDEVVEMALTDIINALRVCYPEGKSGSFISDDGVNHIYSLDNRFPLSDYSTYLTTKKSDARKIDELKQHAYLMVKEGSMAAQDMLSFFKKESFSSIMRDIEDSMNKRSNEIQQNQLKIQQMQEQLAQQREGAEVGKLQGQIAELQSKVFRNQKEMELEQQALDIQRDAEQAKAVNDAERVRLEDKQLDVVANEKAQEVRNK